VSRLRAGMMKYEVCVAQYDGFFCVIFVVQV